MKNYLLFDQNQECEWKIDCAGTTFHLPTRRNYIEACWPDGTCNPGGIPSRETVTQITCLSRLKRIAYELTVSFVAIFPGVGVCFAARDKWDVAHKLDEEMLLVQHDHDVVYAEAKKAANIWEIDLATVDFVTYGSDAPLGAGAFGVVRKARWLGADVAVKELTSAKSQGMDDTMQRQKEVSEDFLMEADIMKSLQHPNIVHFCNDHALFAVPQIQLAHVDIGTASVTFKPPVHPPPPPHINTSATVGSPAHASLRSPIAPSQTASGTATTTT